MPPPSPASGTRPDPTSNAHAGQGQADLPADVLPLVVGGDVHIPGPVIGDFGGLTVKNISIVPSELSRAFECGIAFDASAIAIMRS